MKAYKIELLVVDHEDIGIDEIILLLRDNRYVSPRVVRRETADIGEWDDDHPLNRCDIAEGVIDNYFSE